MNFRFLFFLFLSYCPFNAEAQNLVPNGSFEEVVNCPSTLDALHYDCAYWYKSIQVPGEEMYNNPSPDWYHECGTADLLTPPTVSFGGYQEPYDGEAYAGIITYHEGDNNYREILGVELIEPLISGEVYNISFLVSRGTMLGYTMASNRLGVKLSNDAVFENSQNLINNFAHFSVDTLITDTINWQFLEFSFTPDQNYSFIHIGNFFDDDNVLTEDDGDEFAVLAYYLIDDVRIEAVPLGTIDLNKKLFSISPNPCGDYLTIDSERSIRSYSIMNINGSKLQSGSTNFNKTTSINISEIKQGIYIIKLIDENTNYYYQTFIKQ